MKRHHGRARVPKRHTVADHRLATDLYVPDGDADHDHDDFVDGRSRKIALDCRGVTLTSVGMTYRLGGTRVIFEGALAAAERG
jgi:hypothetical protein